MKNYARKLLVGLALLALVTVVDSQISTALAQGTAFTYQGRLQNNGAAADGTFNLQFLLYTNSSGGVTVAGPVVTNGVAISNGLFTVTMDFGAAVWDGATNWLEIGVETNGGSSFTTLTPRQRVTPTPYAIFAEGSDAAGIVGTIPQANLASTYNGAINFNNGANSFDGSFYGIFYGDSFVGGNFVGNFIGTGSSLTDVWHTGGNLGTTAGVNFVGTTDNQPLELHVNGVRALRLEPTSSNSVVNVIGGSPNNSVAGGIVGATIAGGGALNSGNSVMVNYGTVGGGYANNVNSYAGVVAGGYQNTNNGFAGFIGAGDGNAIIGNGGGDGAFLGGGYSNTNAGEAATIVGGTGNFIGDFANNAAIGGGAQNSIIGSFLLQVVCTIGGGYFNIIQTNVSYGTIGGGTQNVIQPGAHNSTIAGGASNSVSAAYASIGGGYSNNASGPGAFVGGGGYDGSTFLGNQAIGGASVVGGGLGNAANYLYATIGGGQQNTVSYEWGVIGGGQQNLASGAWGSVLGGIYNHATGLQATVGGGANNVASGLASFIGGGGDDGVTLSGNSASGTISVISGGSANNAGGYAATIPGGYGNSASGSNSFAAGKTAVASQSGAFVWADSQPYTFDPFSQAGPQGIINSFNVRSTGGFYIVTGVNTSGTITSGAYLAPGGTSWATLSDRNLKKDFAAVDSQAVLDKLDRIPVEYWHYKWEKDTDVPNLGPMAQDFKAAFYPGRDDKSITTLEFDGVELAAIQGLNKKLQIESQKSETRIQKLEAENADLKARLEKLEQLVMARQGDLK